MSNVVFDSVMGVPESCGQLMAPDPIFPPAGTSLTGPIPSGLAGDVRSITNLIARSFMLLPPAEQPYSMEYVSPSGLVRNVSFLVISPAPMIPSRSTQRTGSVRTKPT